MARQNRTFDIEEKMTYGVGPILTNEDGLPRGAEKEEAVLMPQGHRKPRLQPEGTKSGATGSSHGPP